MASRYGILSMVSSSAYIHVILMLKSLPDQQQNLAHPAPGFSQLYNFFVNHSNKDGRPFLSTPQHVTASVVRPPDALPVPPWHETSYLALPFHYHAELLQAMTHCAGHTNLAWLQHYNYTLFTQIWHAAPVPAQAKGVAEFLDKLQALYKSIHGTC